MSLVWFGPFSLPTWLWFCPLPAPSRAPLVSDPLRPRNMLQMAEAQPNLTLSLGWPSPMPSLPVITQKDPELRFCQVPPMNGAPGELSWNFSCCWESSYTSVSYWTLEAPSLTKHVTHSVMIPKDTRGEVMGTGGGGEGTAILRSHITVCTSRSELPTWLQM